MRAAKPKRVHKAGQLVIKGNELVSFDTLIPSSIVDVAYSSNIISNRAALYCAARCARKHVYQDGDITSIRWEGLTKGKPGGYFCNAMQINVQIDGIDKSAKIYIDKIHLCGVLSEAQGRLVLDSIVNLVHDSNQYIRQIAGDTAYRRLFKQATRWLVANTCGPKVTVYQLFRLRKDPDLGNLYFCKQTEINPIVWPETQDIPIEYREVLKAFRERSDDLLYKPIPHSALQVRIDRLLRYAPFITDYAIGRYTHCHIIYDYNLGMMIDRYMMQTILKKAGYSTYFSNSTSPSMSVSVQSKLKFDPNKMTREDKSGKETFVIYSKGAIRHTGISIESMNESYTKLLNIILQYKDRISIK